MRMEAIQKGAKNIGFSEEVAKQIGGAVTKSSQDVYEKKWQYFQKWCKDNNICQLEANIPQVAELLQHLHKDKKLKPSTIIGYRSALGKVLTFSIVRDTKLQTFQYRILHHIIPYEWLFNIKIKNSNICSFCNETDTVPHI